MCIYGCTMPETTTPTETIDIAGHTDILTPVPDDANNDEAKGRSENMVILPISGEFGYCIGEYLVFSESGSTYTADMTRDGDGEDCDCMHMTFNSPPNGCKHINRAGILMYSHDSPLPEEDEPVEDYFQLFLDAEPELREIREKDDSGDLDLPDDQSNYLDRFLQAIEEIKNNDSEHISYTPN